MTLRRPALPHVGQLRLPVRSAESSGQGGGERGLTHLAITDHDRIEGALRARDAAPAGLTVIVGEEIKTADGDLIALFLERAVAPGRPARETIAEVRAQGGLVGIPHPFDKYRGSMLKDPRLEAIGGAGRLGRGAQRPGRRRERQRAGRGVRARARAARASRCRDAHSVVEVGVAYTAVDVDPSTPEGLLAALTNVELVPGRASYIVRTLTPISKLVNRARATGA